MCSILRTAENEIHLNQLSNHYVTLSILKSRKFVTVDILYPSPTCQLLKLKIVVRMVSCVHGCSSYCTFNIVSAM